MEPRADDLVTFDQAPRAAPSSRRSTEHLRLLPDGGVL